MAGKDTYQVWIETGKLDEVLEFVKECSRKMVSQREMCKRLGITQETFTKLKRRYPVLATVQIEAKMDLKMDLMGALYKRAVGYDAVEETQHIDDAVQGRPPRRKIVRTTKHIPPDKYSAVYLLWQHFGRDYNDKAYDYKLQEEKLKLEKEVWSKDDTSSDD